MVHGEILIEISSPEKLGWAIVGCYLDSNGLGVVGIQVKKHGVLRMSEFIQPSRLTWINFRGWPFFCEKWSLIYSPAKLTWNPEKSPLFNRKQSKPRWWFQRFFYFFPGKLGEASHFDEHIFSDGLAQLPTRKPLKKTALKISGIDLGFS